MKYLFVTILLFVHYQLACAQTVPGGLLLEASSRSRLYYVDLESATATVYTMGRHFDKAGTGYAIMKTDTLPIQEDSSYSNRYFRIIPGKDVLYLVSLSGKKRTLKLNTVSDTNLVNDHLNNAWYLDHYFDFSRELDKAYPLNNHSFREAYYTWKRLPEHEKNMPYLQFRAFADKRLKQVKDSIISIHEICSSLTNNIVQNIGAMGYPALKDSLVRLYAVSGGQSRYYGVVIDTVALQYPEYFFRLAEDLPEHKQPIFSNGVYNKRAFPGLASVEGHDDVKKEFLKKRKAMKALTYQAIATSVLGYTLVAALVIVLL